MRAFFAPTSGGLAVERIRCKCLVGNGCRESMPLPQLKATGQPWEGDGSKEVPLGRNGSGYGYSI